MIKKLDLLIIRAFIPPFLATFLIALFVLVLQFFWLYIDDMVGKGLDAFTILQLVGFIAASTVPLALPIALLLSSIMTFGNLGETFELVAIKSAGISLLRFMRPLLIISIIISCIAFLFSNNIIPIANFKLDTLKRDIVKAKPAFDIKEGTMYDKMPGYIIKIGKKEKDDSTLRDIMIYETGYGGLQDNIMVAEKGIMRVTPDKKYLEFKLENGWRYQEKGPRATTNTEFVRLGFKEYKKIFDVSSLLFERSSDTTRSGANKLTIGQLNTVIDSFSKMNTYFEKESKKQIGSSLRFLRYMDSTWKPSAEKDSAVKAKTYFETLDAGQRTRILDNGINAIMSSKPAYIEVLSNDYLAKQKNLRRHKIEWHKKFALSFACVLMFLIGAPLGSIIRKGGLGMPLVFAIVFFVLYYMINSFGEKFVKENVLTSVGGMWLSTFIFLPISAILIYKALNDSQLFSPEFYFRLKRNFKSLISKTGFGKKSTLKN